MALIEFEYPGDAGRNPLVGAFEESKSTIVFDSLSGEPISVEIIDERNGEHVIGGLPTQFINQIAISSLSTKVYINRPDELDDAKRKEPTPLRLDDKDHQFFIQLLSTDKPRLIVEDLEDEIGKVAISKMVSDFYKQR